VSPLETVLVFGGIPLAVVLLVYGLVYASSGRGVRRYRPGRPFSFEPVWYVAAERNQALEEADAGSRPALGAMRTQHALPAGRPATGGVATALDRGGARGSW
jgi:hypothetical protein